MNNPKPKEVNFYCLPIYFATPEYDEAVQLRYEILRRPLNLEFQPEDLAREYNAFHIACYDTHYNEIKGCLVLVPLDQDTIKMRQVAVQEACQGKGIGTLMVQYAEAFSRRSGYQKMELHARMTAVDFYKKKNYKIYGDSFMEIGMEHLYMSKIL